MDVTRAPITPYSYTLKKLGATEEATEEDYKQIFDRWKIAHINIDCNYYEKDKQGKLHCHGIIELPKGFWRKRLVTKGYHLKIDELFNRAGWIKYITKDIPKLSLDILATQEPPDDYELDEPDTPIDMRVHLDDMQLPFPLTNDRSD